MNIAVTGSNGRMGRALVRAATARGHTVVGIDLRGTRRLGGSAPGTVAPPPAGLSNREVDVRDYGALASAMSRCDGVVHLAAHTSPRAQPPEIVHNDNVTGSYNVLCAAVALGIERVCLASSINAIGGTFSERPRYDRFPVDESHPTYNEDPYSLSKWIVEQQGDSIARRHASMTISTLRLHLLVETRAQAVDALVGHDEQAARELWGYTTLGSAADACLLALGASWTGHERFYLVSSRSRHSEASRVLAERYYPGTPIIGELEGNDGFFDCSKAERLLGWRAGD